MGKPWFKAKSYGWGWYPATWQGWLVLAAYVAILVQLFRKTDAASHSGSDTLIGMVAPFIGLTLMLIAICRATGEEPRWRWGSSKTE